MPIGPKISTPVDSDISGQRTDIRAGIRKSFHYTDLGIRQNLDPQTKIELVSGKSEKKWVVGAPYRLLIYGSASLACYLPICHHL